MRKGFGFFLSAVAALSLSALPTTAAAETTITGTGTFSVTSDVVTPAILADGNIIFVEEITGTLAGVESGAFVVDVSDIIHPSGEHEFYGTLDFTGSVAGVGAGTLVAEITDEGPSAGIFSGQLTLLSGTGDLAGLRGVSFFSSPPPSYSVMYVKP